MPKYSSWRTTISRLLWCDERKPGFTRSFTTGALRRITEAAVVPDQRWMALYAGSDRVEMHLFGEAGFLPIKLNLRMIRMNGWKSDPASRGQYRVFWFIRGIYSRLCDYLAWGALSSKRLLSLLHQTVHQSEIRTRDGVLAFNCLFGPWVCDWV